MAAVQEMVKARISVEMFVLSSDHISRPGNGIVSLVCVCQNCIAWLSYLMSECLSRDLDDDVVRR